MSTFESILSVDGHRRTRWPWWMVVEEEGRWGGCSPRMPIKVERMVDEEADRRKGWSLMKTLV